MRKISICILITLIFLFLTNGCSAPSPEEAVESFEKAYDLALEYQEYTDEQYAKTPSYRKVYIDPEIKSKYLRDIVKALSNAGVGDNNESTGFDESFFQEYLKTHTLDEFFLAYEEITTRLYFAREDDIKLVHDNSQFSECRCKEYQVAALAPFNVLPEYSSVVIPNSFSADMEGMEGYYTEHPDASPQPDEKESSVTLFDEEDIQLYEGTLKDRRIVKYYGDFAVSTTYDEYYNEGQYGWVNGDFIDESGEFGSKTRVDVWYKGNLLYDGDKYYAGQQGEYGVHISMKEDSSLFSDITGEHFGMVSYDKVEE